MLFCLHYYLRQALSHYTKRIVFVHISYTHFFLYFFFSILTREQSSSTRKWCFPFEKKKKINSFSEKKHQFSFTLLDLLFVIGFIIGQFTVFIFSICCICNYTVCNLNAFDFLEASKSIKPCKSACLM